MLSNHTFQHDNILSLTAKEKERERALAALEKAKSIPRKVIFLPKGAGQFARKERKSTKDLDKIVEHLATDLISIDEAIAKTGYKKPTLQGFFRDQLVAGEKIKNKLYFQEDELMRFVAERKSRNPVENICKKNLI